MRNQSIQNNASLRSRVGPGALVIAVTRSTAWTSVRVRFRLDA